MHSSRGICGGSRWFRLPGRGLLRATSRMTPSRAASAPGLTANTYGHPIYLPSTATLVSRAGKVLYASPVGSRQRQHLRLIEGLTDDRGTTITNIALE